MPVGQYQSAAGLADTRLLMGAVNQVSRDSNQRRSQARRDNCLKGDDVLISEKQALSNLSNAFQSSINWPSQRSEENVNNAIADI